MQTKDCLYPAHQYDLSKANDLVSFSAERPELKLAACSDRSPRTVSLARKPYAFRLTDLRGIKVSIVALHSDETFGASSYLCREDSQISLVTAGALIAHDELPRAFKGRHRTCNRSDGRVE